MAIFRYFPQFGQLSFREPCLYSPEFEEIKAFPAEKEELEIVKTFKRFGISEY